VVAPDVEASTDREAGVPILEVRSISKRYGSVAALRGADLTLYPGEVLGLVGDNGAGKSTLVNILSGAITPTGGEILVDGKSVVLRNPLDARACGIETVYQDLALAPDLAIWANLFAGRERLVRGPLRHIGWLDRKGMEAESVTYLERTRIRIGSVNSLVGRLSGGQRQAVAVARAAAWGTRILILDEPTAALGVEQQAKVAELVQTVAADGISVILVTHNLRQVGELCTRTAVMFQGQIIANLHMADTNINEVVSWITGVRVESKQGS
jgi:simple sugar transport system ATP-binding protein